MNDVVFVPAVPALLPVYASLADPIAELRTACHEAVRALVVREPARVILLGAADDGDVRGMREPSSVRIGHALLEGAGYAGPVDAAPLPGPVPDRGDASYLVVADGSACRGDSAPGVEDLRAEDFDATITDALRSGDPATLLKLDADLGAELLATGVPVWHALGDALTGMYDARVTYADAPYGVHYVVAEWLTPAPSAGPAPRR